MHTQQTTPISSPAQVHPQESNATFAAIAAKRLPAGHHEAPQPFPRATGEPPSLAPAAVEQIPNNGHPGRSGPDPAWYASEAAPLEWGKPRRDLPDVNFRHSGWKPLRDRTFAAMTAAGTGQARLDRYEQCGCNAWVLRSLDDPDRLKLASNKCHDRFCRLCGNERSRTMAVNVRKALNDKVQRFLTLTLKTDETNLVDTLDLLIRSFSRLRTSKLWDGRVTGGVSFLEIKRSSRSDRWHCHLHVITEGRYIPKEELSRVWKRITHGSFIVDIRIIRDTEKTIRYVTKYAAKPIDPSNIHSDEHLLEAIKAVAGRRLAITFGAWRGVSLSAPPEDGDWEPLGTLNDLLQRARSGDQDAVAVIVVLQGDEPCRNKAPPEPTLPF